MYRVIEESTVASNLSVYSCSFTLALCCMSHFIATKGHQLNIFFAHTTNTITHVLHISCGFGFQCYIQRVSKILINYSNYTVLIFYFENVKVLLVSVCPWLPSSG